MRYFVVLKYFWVMNHLICDLGFFSASYNIAGI